MQPPAPSAHTVPSVGNVGVTTPSIHPWQPRPEQSGPTSVVSKHREQPATQIPILSTLQTATPPLSDTTPLPSLLQYVDNDLLRRRSEYNYPPAEAYFCSACGKLHNGARIRSTYLPLTCGCWMHYRCFIGHVVQQGPNKRGNKNDCCPACGTQLFIWEGIVVLTLSQRTDVLLPNYQFTWRDSYADEHTGYAVTSDRSAYESDCALISALIQKRFLDTFAPNAPASRYADASPDLTACYYGVLQDLGHYGRPRAKWLSFSRTGSVGFFLFGMIVVLKMRGFLIEHHAAIVETEGWADFENTREELRGEILKEVRGGGWSWAAVESG
ncbi:hypothetical protein SLS60_000183 [Paraconiothyrium brasiliense]|uniref:RING-type domain-containing protein n=1 Tax=Paraconiothyrium brasiliense TaxID=300254 RepID=A0ABR3S5I2_9PLEO